MNKKLLILSLPYILSILPIPAAAAIRVGNLSRSYADAYNQVNVQRQQQEYYNQQIQNPGDSLPVRVANADLANKIARGDTSIDVGVADLESCAAIYPGGVFAWDKPTAGNKVSRGSTCVATVEMRLLKGTEDVLLARANIASGDSVKCNISDFPEAGYTTDATTVTFPADAEPTMDDVVKIMNEEQKKNAGLKIAAGLVVGGLVGNAAGKNELGKDGLLGGGKGKVQGTAIGALSGAAVMAGNTYGGKVGGDVILSTGVNAAAGGVIGNMVGGGNDVLRIEDCTDLNGATTKCLWGVIEKNKPIGSGETGFYNISSDSNNTIVCNKDMTGCRTERLIGIVFADADYKSVEDGKVDQNFLKIRNAPDKLYTYDVTTNKMSAGYTGDSNGMWTLVKSAGRPTQRIAAMIPAFKDKTFGSKMSDWYKWRTDNSDSATLIGRNNMGVATKLPDKENWSINDFYPLTISADDGAIIDINNKARLGGTLTGAATGAGLGAFTAYQGAQDEVDQRWVTSVQEYKDSLQKIYCATGTRFLSSYNDIAIIPNMSN